MKERDVGHFATSMADGQTINPSLLGGPHVYENGSAMTPEVQMGSPKSASGSIDAVEPAAAQDEDMEDLFGDDAEGDNDGAKPESAR
jgi:hypothetical protein